MVVGEIQEGVDVIVIGAGPGGYVAAIRAAQLGREVYLIDSMDRLGGVCLNCGCIPSKALIHVANVFSGLDSAKDYGISVQGKALDFKKLQEWKEGIISQLSKGVAQLCKENGVTVHQGTARFTSNNSLFVASTEKSSSFKFKNAIIATGSCPLEVPGLSFNEDRGIVSSRGALNWTELPKKLAVIGAGYIGIELGTVYAKLGSEVTMIEALDRILPELDPTLGKPVAKHLKSLGVTTKLNTTAENFDGKALHLSDGSEIAVDKVLVAVGRRPNSENLGLEKAGIEIDEKGFIKTGPDAQTTQANIYAIGDVAGGALLAHKASAEGKIAAEAICGQKVAFDNYVPAVIFSDPEIAVVGLSETEAQKQGLEIKAGQFPFAALGRAMASHATEGFVKVISEEPSKRLLGFQIVGTHASELIATATHALEMGALVDDLSQIINTHPTFSEAIGEAIESIYGKAIHLSPRKQN